MSNQMAAARAYLTSPIKGVCFNSKFSLKFFLICVSDNGSKGKAERVGRLTLLRRL